MIRYYPFCILNFSIPVQNDKFKTYGCNSVILGHLMWAVIEKLLSYGDPPIPTLTPQRARMTIL
ncbi:hypothetical protein SAMN05660293_03708 [Dyadobacter psychrophilus]|uniref:Uncharacterized protein n=1 Tax=Dyadobacter psychrophilus TaxID=651661 RepID=A0A1T5G5Q5_9BACT|nr:hypothetical protein SAMN05660293_03708 [Dyadobacter psychrophilus]